MNLQRLEKLVSTDARIDEISGGWRLSLDAKAKRSYRLAQLDDYGNMARRAFPHRSPKQITLKARASNDRLPGTWGFGLWNDPFGLSLGFGPSARRFPALPNAAWFFFASSENSLAFQDGLPGNGAMASVYRSPKIPALFLAFNLPLLPLLTWRAGARWLRRRAAKFIQQDAKVIEGDQREWRQYRMVWKKETVRFFVDGREILQTKISPIQPLGLVVWLDNQYAAWTPDGRVGYGILPTPEDCWVEIKDLRLD